MRPNWDDFQKKAKSAPGGFSGMQRNSSKSSCGCAVVNKQESRRKRSEAGHQAVQASRVDLLSSVCDFLLAAALL